MKRMIGIAVLLAAATMAVPSTAEAVSVTFNWPAGAWGFWECTGSGGRVYGAGKTIEFADNTTYTIYGDGWGTGLKIQVTDGVASILQNTDNVGIVDNGDNTFTWVAATFNVIWQRSTFYEFSGSGRKYASLNDIKLIYAPKHSIYCDGPWYFGLASDGTVSPSTSAPAYALFAGNTMTLSAVKVDVTIDWPAGCVGYYEMTGSGGRATVDKTITLDDDLEYQINGAGWDYDTLRIKLQSGTLTISRNTSNVGVTVDNVTKTVTFAGVSVTIDSARPTFWEVEGTGRVTGSKTFVVAVAPKHIVYEDSIKTYPSFLFGVDAAGTITMLGNVPWWVVVEGSLMIFESDAADVTFEWTAGLRGWWECTGSGGRVYNAGKTVSFVGGDFMIGGDDWHEDTLHVGLMDGVAYISKNLDNVGLVDNGDNNFTWQGAEITVNSARPSWWESNQTGRITGSHTWLTVPSDWHKLSVDPGTTFHFAVDVNGTITLAGDAPAWATAEGNVITLATEAVDVTFNWPAGAGGFYEFAGSGGRQYATKTFPMENGAYIIQGAGWNFDTLVVTLTDGVAAITKDTEGVGLVDNGGNAFTFVATSFEVQTERKPYYQIRAVNAARMRGNSTTSLIPGPAHVMDGPGLNGFSFGVDAAGTVTLGAGAPAFVTAAGSVMTIASQSYQCDPDGSASGWQIGVLDAPGGNVGDNLDFLTGVQSVGLTPGAYVMQVNCIPGQWLGHKHEFQINADWTVSNGVWTYVDEAEGSVERTFVIGDALVPVTVSCTAADQSTGSLVFTNSATVDVTITVDPPEAVIVGWLITESDVEPTEGWLAEVPTTYTITGAEGTVTLHAWVIDDTDTVASGTVEILFSTAVPQVLSRTVTDNGDGTATATWTTDIAAEGGVKYGLVTMAGTTPNTTPLEGTVGTSHSVSFAIAAGANYKVILVNNETDSPSFFWPLPWAVAGDANMDCRVNILDLIFIRNKLNQAVGTGDNWQADVNQDTKINILDLIFVRNKLNTACP